MKPLSLVLLVLLAACAPVSQTATNVSRLVQGIQVVPYKGTASEISSTVIDLAKLMQMGGSYTPLSVTMYTSEKMMLSSKALKGSISRSLDAKDFSIDVLFAENNAVTEVTFRPSDSDLAKAQEVIKNLTAELDKRFSRYTP
jgi:hypothetical protein